MSSEEIDNFARACFEAGAITMKVDIAKFFMNKANHAVAGEIFDLPLPSIPSEVANLKEGEDAPKP